MTDFFNISIAQFNWLDYTILGVIVLSLLVGLIRGFVREFISLLTWVVAIGGALWYAPFLARHMNSIQSTSLRYGIAFMVVFFVVMILGIILGALIGFIMNKTGLGIIDRLLGMIFGLGRGILLMALVFLAGNFLDIHLKGGKSSQLAPKFSPLVLWLNGYIPQLHDLVNPQSLIEAKDKVNEKNPLEKEDKSVKGHDANHSALSPSSFHLSGV